jgi:hypothetical protein
MEKQIAMKERGKKGAAAKEIAGRRTPRGNAISARARFRVKLLGTGKISEVRKF